jgi:hypothetical protein
MVNRDGQAITEYILMLGIMTLIGLWIMRGLTGNSLQGNSGALAQMDRKATRNIANDERP